MQTDSRKDSGAKRYLRIQSCTPSTKIYIGWLISIQYFWNWANNWVLVKVTLIITKCLVPEFDFAEASKLSPGAGASRLQYPQSSSCHRSNGLASLELSETTRRPKSTYPSHAKLTMSPQSGKSVRGTTYSAKTITRVLHNHLDAPIYCG